MANDNKNVIYSGDNETVKTKKKEKSTWKTIGKVAAGVIAIVPIVMKEIRDRNK